MYSQNIDSEHGIIVKIENSYIELAVSPDHTFKISLLGQDKENKVQSTFIDPQETTYPSFKRTSRGGWIGVRKPRLGGSLLLVESSLI